MKKYLLIILLLFTIICASCNTNNKAEVIDGFSINKYVFEETENIIVKTSDYGKGYYIGIFNINSEPGKSGGYRKKALNDEDKEYIFKVSDLRGSGEYNIFLYQKTTNVIVKKEVIKILTSDTNDYKITNASYFSSTNDGVNTSGVKITPTTIANDGLTYRLYWANNNQRLKDYEAIKVVQINSQKEFEVKFNDCMFTPSEATQIEVEVFEGRSTSYFLDIDDSLKLPSSNYLFNFQVMSDVHLDNEYSFNHHANHLTSAINEIKSLSDKTKGVFFVGDLSNFGNDGNYEFLTKMFNKLNPDNELNINFIIGNHECQYYDSFAIAKEKFLNFAKRDKVYTSIEIEGIKFIFLGQESVTTHGQMTNEQVEWFEKEIEKTDKSKPTFIFMHQPLSDTVNGSFSGQGNSGMGNVSSKLKSILKKYPNAYMFSGHSHRTPDLEQTAVYGKGANATFVNTGSLGYLLGLNDEEIGGSSGLFVEVYSDYIVIKARNFLDEKWYGSSQYVFPIVK